MLADGRGLQIVSTRIVYKKSNTDARMVILLARRGVPYKSDSSDMTHDLQVAEVVHLQRLKSRELWNLSH